MAEAVVKSVLEKLADVAFNEAIFLWGVKAQVEAVERDLVRIRCFLKDADSKCKSDSRIENWVKELRRASFLIEDAIDTFLVDIWRIDKREVGLRNKLRRISKKPFKLYFMRTLGKKIHAIQAIIKEISDNRAMYGIKTLEEIGHEPANPLRKGTVSKSEEQMVGFDDAYKEIIKLLLGEHENRHVVSIVGQGGLGKTTLARKIYNSSEVKKSHFDFQIWLTISKEYHSVGLLKGVLGELQGINNEDMDGDEEYFANKINELLRDKKYLVVLDDIWEEAAWDDLFKQTFPNLNGSRVLITTRFLNVANKANRGGVHELRLLNKHESLQLMFQKAIPKEDGITDYPTDLCELAEKFVEICDGLPLALVVVGGLLSIKDQNYHTWEKVLNTMDWNDKGKECTNVLASSFGDLSLPLKSCFIYLALFPEGHVIEAESVISLWVAEGLIPNEGRVIVEHVAHDYLDELAQRCMIQVSKRSYDGCIKQFRVHDLLLELAINEAKDKEFLKVFSKGEGCHSDNVARRASFHLAGHSRQENTSFESKNLIEYTDPNIRTLFFFKEVVPFDSQFKLLRVLVVIDLTISDNNQIWWDCLKRLLHLKYLEFKECSFTEFLLPVDHLLNLQTLKLYGCRGIEVPMSLWRIKALRHVIVYDNGFERELELAPADLPNLQTLEEVVIHEPIVGPLNMPNLHKLSLKNYSSSWEAIVALLAKLVNLVYLKLDGGFIPQEIISLLSKYGKMQTLKLVGRWPKDVAMNMNVDAFPPHLTKLILDQSRIKQNFVPLIEKLQSLRILVLDNAYEGKEFICSKGGFCKLEKLSVISLYEIEKWEIEEGAFPMLKELKIVRCKKLRELPKLQYVTALKTFHLGMPKEFIWRVRNLEQYKIKHIPSITMDESDY